MALTLTKILDNQRISLTFFIRNGKWYVQPGNTSLALPVKSPDLLQVGFAFRDLTPEQHDEMVNEFGAVTTAKLLKAQV